jgi:hypothetical protein
MQHLELIVARTIRSLEMLYSGWIKEIALVSKHRDKCADDERIQDPGSVVHSIDEQKQMKSSNSS